MLHIILKLITFWNTHVVYLLLLTELVLAPSDEYVTLTSHWIIFSDVKRGQNLEAETEAEARVLRQRPSVGQSFEVKAEANFLRSKPAEAKDKFVNKKYQMMVDWRIYIIMIRTI